MKATPGTQSAGRRQDIPSFHSLEDVHRYVQDLSTRKAAEDRVVKLWRCIERLTLVLILAASVFTYYMLAVIERIITLPHLDIPAVRLTIRTLSILGPLR